MYKKALVVPLVVITMMCLSSCEKEKETTLNEYIYIRVDSVTATSVFLYWTRSTSGKFHAYEIHQGKKTRFLTSLGTLRKTFLARDSTRTSIDSLVTGQPYYFKAKIIYSDGSSTESLDVPAIPQ